MQDRGEGERKAADNKDESADTGEGGKGMPQTIATTMGLLWMLGERDIRIRKESKAAEAADTENTGSGTKGKRNGAAAMAGGETDRQLGGGSQARGKRDSREVGRESRVGC